MKYVLSPNTKYSLLPDRVLIKHDGHIFTLSGDQLKLIKTIIASLDIDGVDISEYDEKSEEKSIINTFITRGWAVQKSLETYTSYGREATAFKNLGITNYSDRLYKEKNILIIGFDDLLINLNSVIENFGFNNITLFKIEGNKFNDYANLKTKIKTSDLIVLFGSDNNSEFNLIVNKICIDGDVPVLFVSTDGVIGKIGPFVIPNKSACYKCYLTRRAASSVFHDEIDVLDNAKHYGKIYRIEGALMSTLQLTYVVIASQIKEYFLRNINWSLPSSVDGLIEVNGLNYNSKSRGLLRVPYCEHCSHAFFESKPWADNYSY